MATAKENERLARIEEKAEHIIAVISAVEIKVDRLNGSLRETQVDMAVVQARNEQFTEQNRGMLKLIEDLCDKYEEVKDSNGMFAKIGAVIGFVLTVLIGGGVTWLLIIAGKV